MPISRNPTPQSGRDRSSQPYRHAVGMSKWLATPIKCLRHYLQKTD